MMDTLKTMAIVSFQIYTFAALLLGSGNFKSLRIFLLFLLIPSLSLGLTFSNGKEVKDNNSNKTKVINNDTVNDKYVIKNPGLIFIGLENLIENISASGDKKIDDCRKYRSFAKKNFDNYKFEASREGDIKWSIEDDLTGPLTVIFCKYLSGKVLDKEDENLQSQINLIKTFLIKLSQSDYLNSFPKQNDDSQHAYETSGAIIPTLFIYSQFQNEFNLEEKSKIKKMFLDLEKKNRYTFNPSQVGDGSTYNNHGMYTNNYRLLVSILFNEKKMFNESINFFLEQMKYNETETGLFKIDSKRGSCALHYNLHNLSPLMSILWNLNLQGIDLSEIKLNSKHSISDIISVIIDSVEDPKLVIEQNKKLGYSSPFSLISCYNWMSNEEKNKYVIKFNNEDLVMPYASSYWINIFMALTDNQNVYNKFISSQRLQNQYYYDGSDEESFVGLYSKYFLSKPLELDKINKNDLLEELETAIQ